MKVNNVIDKEMRKTVTCMFSLTLIYQAALIDKVAFPHNDTNVNPVMPLPGIIERYIKTAVQVD